LLKLNIRVRFLAFAAAAAIARTSRAFSAGGFSQKTCLPARSACRATGAWYLLGTMTDTASSLRALPQHPADIAEDPGDALAGGGLPRGGLVDVGERDDVRAGGAEARRVIAQHAAGADDADLDAHDGDPGFPA
jgi:hypothetical protein